VCFHSGSQPQCSSRRRGGAARPSYRPPGTVGAGDVWCSVPCTLQLAGHGAFSPPFWFCALGALWLTTRLLALGVSRHLDHQKGHLVRNVAVDGTATLFAPPPSATTRVLPGPSRTRGSAATRHRPPPARTARCTGPKTLPGRAGATWAPTNPLPQSYHVRRVAGLCAPSLLRRGQGPPAASPPPRRPPQRAGLGCHINQRLAGPITCCGGSVVGKVVFLASVLICRVCLRGRPTYSLRGAFPARAPLARLAWPPPRCALAPLCPGRRFWRVSAHMR